MSHILLILALVSNLCSTIMADGNIKTVYLIRHAESEENRRLGSLKQVFGDMGRFSLPKTSDIAASISLLNIPAQVDSDVSSVGKEQIQEMAEILKKENFLSQKNVQLVAHSPLIRAQQTSEGLLGCSVDTSDKSIIKKAEPVTRVVELDLVLEKTPAEWLPGGQASLEKRMQDFEVWVGEQPEDRIAIVGHSQYFKAMLNLDFKFGNCDVWQVKFHTSGEHECSEEEKYNVPRNWSDLKLVYSIAKSD